MRLLPLHEISRGTKHGDYGVTVTPSEFGLFDALPLKTVISISLP